jgi:hypothetical protein
MAGKETNNGNGHNGAAKELQKLVESGRKKIWDGSLMIRQKFWEAGNPNQKSRTSGNKYQGRSIVQTEIVYEL